MVSFFYFKIQWKGKVTVWARSGSLVPHNFSIIKLGTELWIVTGNKLLSWWKKLIED